MSGVVITAADIGDAVATVARAVRDVAQERIAALEAALAEAVDTLEMANEVVAAEGILDREEVAENDRQIERLRAVAEDRASRWPGDAP